MRAIAYDTLDELARAAAALPAPGPLPSRTVIVRSERQAHALRAALAAPTPGAPGPHPLAGTRLVLPLGAAEEVLHAAGVRFTAGERGLRRARLARALAGPVAARLERFPAALLAGTPGWDDAFAGAILTLEGAGLAPADLARAAGPNGAALRDLGALWAAIEAEAARSLTPARLLLEAAAALEADGRRWPHPGAVLAPVDGHEPAALARFLEAIPGVTIALRRARPARARFVERVRTCLGDAVAALAAEPPALPAPGAGGPATELARLKALLFHPDPAAAAALGPGPGPDGTVELEEHAGVEAELDATAAWVAREVLERGTPLARIAVLLPARDPLAGLVADRIRALGLAVHVAGGLPATGTSAGARALALLRALRRRLPAEDVAAVLPFLELEGDERGHLSHGAALALAYALGTAGGSAARPAGALDWARRAAERPAELEAAIAAARAAGGSDERELRDLEHRLRDLRAVRGSLEALVGVAGAVLEGRPLAEVWPLLRAFLEARVRLPGDGARLLGPLAEALEAAVAAPGAGELRGDAALDVVREALEALRLPAGRSGEAAVHVGPLATAAGLAFDAVRIVGLAEGSVPPAPREDPVLPSPVRAALEALAGRPVPSPEDRVAAGLHAFHAAVLAAGARLSLSAPRVGLDRTEREPAAVLIEVAAALRRPDRRTGEPGDPVPSGQALRRDGFDPAREAALASRAASPVSDADWLLRAARGAREVPPSWRGEDHLDLERAAALHRPGAALGRADGLLAPGPPFPPVPGLSAEHPISATALGELVACPRRFLMRRVLRWSEPASAPSLRELEPDTFGSLVHRTLERLYRAHGPAIVGGEGDLARWQEAGRRTADLALDELLRALPLLGAPIREKERRRLHAAVEAFVAYDLAAAGAGRRYVDVERGFGTAGAPLALPVPGGALHVRGYVDRLDATPGHVLVRDVKTGKAHPRRPGEPPDAPRDVQLGLYVKVARALAGAWGVPSRARGAYAYASGRGEVEERAFDSDADVAALEASTEEWLGLARALLEDRRFPATPDHDDCAYCDFGPLCGREAPRRARAGLALVDAREDATLAAYRALRLPDGEDAP